MRHLTQYIVFLILMSPAVVWYFACLNLVFSLYQLLPLVLLILSWAFRIVFPVMFFLEDHTS